jgi:hypothetical protein
MGKPDTPSERKRIAKAFEREGKCTRCPPHRGENTKHGKKRTDKYKNHRGASSE